MRYKGELQYAARALRGYFSTNLPISATVRRDFRLDLLGALIYGAFNGSVVGYLYVVARTIGVSQTGISLLMAMSAVGAILALPASLLPRTGNGGRRFLFVTWGLGRAVIFLVLISSAPSLYVLCISVFLISASVAMPFYAQILQHIYPREFRGQLMSLVRVGSGAATTVSSLLTAWLLGSGLIGFQALFAVGSVLSVISLAVFTRVTPVRPPPRPRQSMRDTFRLLGVNKPFARYQVWVFLMGAGNIMSATLYPLVIVDKLHAGYGPFGVLTVITALGYLSSFLIWGRVIDRRGPVFTIMLVGVCILTFPLGMLAAPSVYWLAPVMFINGMANAGFEIGPFAAVMHYSLATPAEVPRYMALHSILAGTRGLICPFLATFILAGHLYGTALITGFSFSAAGTFMLWRLSRREASSSAQAEGPS